MSSLTLQMQNVNVKRVAAEAALLFALGAALGFVFLPGTAKADPQTSTGSCSTPIDDLGAFVNDINGITGAAGAGASGKYGSLSGCLNAESMQGQIDKLSADKRKQLAGELLTALGDPALMNDAGAQTRANALGMLTGLAKKGLASGDDYYFNALMEAANNEKDPNLRRQAALNLDSLTGSMNAAQKKAVDGLTSAYMPKDPPYDTIFGKDGKKTDINYVIHGGDDTFSDGDWENVAKQNGATVKKIGPGRSLEITYKVKPDDPTGKLKPVTFHIKVMDEASGGFQDLRVFNDMNNADIPMESYSYHSQYGRALRESMENAPKSSGLDKVFLLGSCKGKVFRARAARLYPNAQFISTIDSEYFYDMSRSQFTFMKSFANRESWDQIRRRMNSTSGLLHEDNYIFPDDRRQLSYLDTDGDGIPDRYDPIFNYGLKDAPKVANDFTPREPVAGPCALSGDRVSFAVNVADGMLGYSTAISGIEGKWVPDGWGDYDKNGPAFTFTKGKNANGDDVWFVKGNPAYSHLDDNGIVAAALHDMTMQYRTSQHSGPATTDDKLDALAQAAQEFEAWDGYGDWDNFQKKYGVDGHDFSFWDLTSKIDHEDGVTPDTLKWMNDQLHAAPGGTN
ncbi:MAG TPA: hypothetical protein VMV18_06855 [bacterium]|nr:hypothetical protein [bacterium]